MESVYKALRNHYRLSLLYLRELGQVNAGILNISFSPASGCPTEVGLELSDWSRLQGFGTQSALAFHLLNSFMPEALVDASRVEASIMSLLQSNGLETIDLQDFHRIRGGVELHSYDEQSFFALLGQP
jgi:hypothetical protein